jgi:hypothetical protein
VHTVGKFDHDHRALARCSNQAPRHGPRALSELSKDYVHTVNLASSRPTSTAVTAMFFLERPRAAEFSRAAELSPELVRECHLSRDRRASSSVPPCADQNP